MYQIFLILKGGKMERWIEMSCTDLIYRVILYLQCCLSHSYEQFDGFDVHIISNGKIVL